MIGSMSNPCNIIKFDLTSSTIMNMIAFLETANQNNMNKLSGKSGSRKSEVQGTNLVQTLKIIRKKHLEETQGNKFIILLAAQVEETPRTNKQTIVVEKIMTTSATSSGEEKECREEEKSSLKNNQKTSKEVVHTHIATPHTRRIIIHTNCCIKCLICIMIKLFNNVYMTLIT